MRCPICDTENKWTNIDHLRLKKQGLALCATCGFGSYPGKIKSEEEIKEYYRKEYRPGPQANNLFTGERKLQYHAMFLTPLFEEWKKAGLNAPVVGEIGGAMGMCLNWVKQQFPEADIHGTELTETFRRVAYHEYGIKLVEDFDTSKKYDLIISYHVLEHQAEPDKMLTQYLSCLNDNGVMYLSAPIWFREASNGAAGGFDIEYHWHPDHINCWGDEHLDHLISKAGGEIIMKNNAVYGNTYLIKKTSATNMVQPNWSAKPYLDLAERFFKSWQFIQENKTELAIDQHKNCPAAWVNHYELNRQHFHKNRELFDNFFADANKSCTNSADIPMFHGDVLTRYERYDDALEAFRLALSRKPNNPTILMGISNCYRMKAEREKDQAKKDELLNRSINVLRLIMTTSTEMLPQAISWAYVDESKMSVPL
jgi:SAM-dependent methyltransferase